MAMTSGCATGRWKPARWRNIARWQPRSSRKAPRRRCDAARDELMQGLGGLLDKKIVAGPVADGAVVIGTPASSPLVAGLKLPLTSLGPEGYLIRSATLNGHPVTVIAANSDIGVLYGSFAFLRLIQTRQAVAHLDIASVPTHQDPRSGSLGQSRRHHRARLCRPFHLRLAEDSRLYGPALYGDGAGRCLGRHQCHLAEQCLAPMPGCCRRFISRKWRRWRRSFAPTASASMSPPASARRWNWASSRPPIPPIRK